MTKTTLTALYDARDEADRAAERLVAEAGVARSDVNVIAQGSTLTSTAPSAGRAEDTGFFASLKSMFVPEEDHGTYSEAVRRGGFLLTARVEGSSAERVMDILEEHGAVDLDERQQAWRASGWTDGNATGGARTLADGTVVTTAAATTTAAPAPVAASARPATALEGEERIDIAEERLRVGKRTTQGGRVRVRSYVVETPVEEQVTLRDETVHVERRTLDRAPTAADGALFQDRVIEATETDEEAVVSKTAHVTGEVVVNKTTEERVETVRDTVRRTEVEVDEAANDATIPARVAGDPRPAAKPPAPRR